MFSIQCSSCVCNHLLSFFVTSEPGQIWLFVLYLNIGTFLYSVGHCLSICDINRSIVFEDTITRLSFISRELFIRYSRRTPFLSISPTSVLKTIRVVWWTSYVFLSMKIRSSLCCLNVQPHPSSHCWWSRERSMFKSLDISLTFSISTPYYRNFFIRPSIFAWLWPGPPHS